MRLAYNKKLREKFWWEKLLQFNLKRRKVFRGLRRIKENKLKPQSDFMPFECKKKLKKLKEEVEKVLIKQKSDSVGLLWIINMD